MNQLIFIVVIIAICISINADVLAKVKFGKLGQVGRGITFLE